MPDWPAAWVAHNDAISASLAGRFALTLMLVMSVGMLMYVLYGERPPEFYNPGAARGDNPASRGNNVPPGAGHRP